MPELGSQSSDTTLYLPSTQDEPNEADRAWIRIKAKLDLGDLLEVQKQTTELEQGIVLLSRMIQEWNFTADGQPVLITTDSVQELDVDDFIYVSEWISTNTPAATGLAADEKKSSSSTSATASTDTIPATPDYPTTTIAIT